MVTRRRIVVAFIGIAIVGAGLWWFLHDPWIPLETWHAPEEYPEFSLTIDGEPPGPEIPLKEFSVLVARSLRPPRFPDAEEFTAIITITPADDERKQLYFTPLFHQREGQSVLVSRDGMSTDVTPPLPEPDDPHIQLSGLMGAPYEGTRPSDLVDRPLTMWVWMYPIVDEEGNQRKEDAVLILRNDFKFVHSAVE